MLNIGKTPEGAPVALKPAILTTHAFIVGMTGSGKTGLAVALLEEIAKAGIPALILDPKGDLPNLMLLFPELKTADFAPYTPDPDDAARRWTEGLAAEGLGTKDVAALKDAVDRQIVTPGSSVAPVNFLPSLRAPSSSDMETEVEQVRERIRAVVSALLKLLGIHADPFTDPRHIFLSLLMEHFFKAGKDASLADLILNLEDPPFSTLGVLPLESAFPLAERRKLVFALNALLSSPGFSSWFEGPPLDMERWLWSSDGRPRHTIVYLNHLSEEMKTFALTLVLTELFTYIRKQPGSSSLKHLLYFDEISGFLPPSPANPPIKAPLLSLLKTGRAFGLGVVLATQNTVDADYKALANMGTWFVGRLHTDQDKRRISDVLGSDPKAEEAISSLAPRSFWFKSLASGETARILKSRFVMSYLKGPMTLAELKPFAAAHRDTSATPRIVVHAAPVLAVDTPVMYSISSGEKQLFIAAETRVFLRDAAGRSWSVFKENRVYFLRPISPSGSDWVLRETLPPIGPHPAEGSSFTLPEGFEPKEELRDAENSVKFYAPKLCAKMILHNEATTLYADPGGDRAAFEARCLQSLAEKRQAEEDKIRKSFGMKLERLREQRERERQKMASEQEELKIREQERSIGILEAGLGTIFGGRKLSTIMRRAATGISRTGTKRRQILASETQIQASRQKIEYADQQSADLEAEITAEARRIEQKYAEMASAVIQETVAPDRKDVRVEQVSLVWLALNEVNLQSGS